MYLLGSFYILVDLGHFHCLWIYWEIWILPKSLSEIHFQLKMPYIKKKIQKAVSVQNINQKCLKTIMLTWKSPKEGGDGALSQESVPLGNQGLLPSSELTIQGMLRMLVVRGLFAGARLYGAERERGGGKTGWQWSIKLWNRVNKTLKLKQEGIRGHGSWQLTKHIFFWGKSAKTIPYCSLTHPTKTATLMILVFVTNQKPMNLAQ